MDLHNRIGASVRAFHDQSSIFQTRDCLQFDDATFFQSL